MKRMVKLANGDMVPAIGMGTWYLGENPDKRQEELASLKAGISQGIRLIDTAEMYGCGESERLVAEAIRHENRNNLYLVSKFYPSNASRSGVKKACDDSLKRLETDYLDLYLYHWRGSIPLAETVSALEELKCSGKIKNWGVSNFDLEDMKDLFKVKDGNKCLVNQVLYHMGSRGIEFELLPWMLEKGVTLMAYCPLAQGGKLKPVLLKNKVLQKIAKEHQCSIYQILLAWTIRNGNTIAIPRSSKKEHTLDNAGSVNVILSETDLQRIDSAFPPPIRRTILDMQ